MRFPTLYIYEYISAPRASSRTLYTFVVCQGEATQEINDLYLIRFSLQHKNYVNYVKVFLQ